MEPAPPGRRAPGAVRDRRAQRPRRPGGRGQRLDEGGPGPDRAVGARPVQLARHRRVRVLRHPGRRPPVLPRGRRVDHAGGAVPARPARRGQARGPGPGDREVPARRPGQRPVRRGGLITGPARATGFPGHGGAGPPRWLPAASLAPRETWHPGGVTAAGGAAGDSANPGAVSAAETAAVTVTGAAADPGTVTAAKHAADLSPVAPAGRVREETISRLQQAMGSLGTAAMASMEQRLPWFRGMSAENRSWIGLVAQAGIAAFVDWVKHPERSRSAVAGEVFGTAPRELARAVSLQQVVEMVRVTIDVVEARVDELAAPGGEAELREAVLHYTREVAFAAARVYARTAEARGAWDARLEALVVDSLVRGEIGEGVHSWASALNWSSAPVAVIVGTAEDDEPEGLIDELRVTARRARLDLLAGVQGNKLVVVLGGTDDPLTAAQQFAGRFGNGPLVVGPVVTDLYAAASSAAAALAGMRAAHAWPDAPRPVLASDLLPERALDGDEAARAELVEEVYEPLLSGGSALIDTVMTYFEQGFSLEAAARLLFVHPNTVRYRLRRVSELTGLIPTQGRGGFTLWVAIVLGRLIHKRT